MHTGDTKSSLFESNRRPHYLPNFTFLSVLIHFALPWRKVDKMNAKKGENLSRFSVQV